MEVRNNAEGMQTEGDIGRQVRLCALETWEMVFFL